MEKNLRITYSSSIDRLCEVNSSFDKGVLKVAYVGDNRNGSSISKEAFERSMGTIYNCPIVCNYNRERDEIGSHDMEVVQKDGKTKLVNITTPVGIVPESSSVWWESFEDVTGIHEYLCAEVLIWKRQEAYEKIKENGITDESMEINVKSGYMKDNIYVIESFEFTAFCLLESAKPCYESASLEMFGMDEFRKKYAEMMEEFKENFKKVNTSVEDDIHPQNNSKGGEVLLEQKMELLAKLGLTLEQLDFDIESMTAEELEVKLHEISDGGNGGQNGSGNGNAEFALSGEQFREGLIEALGAETVETVWGEMSRYMYCDYDADTSEVYCYDMEDWKLYGFPFSMNGDHVVVDFACKKRKKFSIVDFDEGDADFSHQHLFEKVADASAAHKAAELNTRFEAERTELEEKYNAASETMNTLNNELTELRRFKQQKLDEERAADEGAVFAMFADLNGIDAFEELRTNCSELSINELEDKCYALRGRNNTKAFSLEKPKSVRLPVERHHAADEPYGGLFVEFPPTH